MTLLSYGRYHNWVILREAAFGGRVCPEPALRMCNTKLCPAEDCKVDTWGSYGACTHTCGTGTQIRHRQVLAWPVNGGKSCPTIAEMNTCGTAVCKIDCQSKWTAWSVCAKHVNDHKDGFCNEVAVCLIFS